MKRISNLLFPSRLQHLFPRSLLFGLLTTASVVTGSLSFIPQVKAQTPTANNTDDITNYAQAVLAMETPRQQAFDEIKRLIGGGEIPKIICNDPRSMNTLPRQAQEIAVNYCNRSQKIVEDNGLTIDRFNKITIELQNNNNLKRQVYNTLIRLQRKP